MLLDRNRERAILDTLATIYPNKASPQGVAARLDPPISADSDEFVAEVIYLREHGLIDAVTKWVSGNRPGGMKLLIANLAITAKGMDFLQDDGGLSAILGVVTVRLHDDTIKALLIDKVSQSDGDPSVKDQMVATIKALPAEATKSIAMRLMEHGVAAAPSSLGALRTLLGL